MSTLETYQVQLVNDSLAVGALKFGSFTLKSGRCVLMFLSNYVCGVPNSPSRD